VVPGAGGVRAQVQAAAAQGVHTALGSREQGTWCDKYCTYTIYMLLYNCQKREREI
jgi:hypothetical protein